MSLKALADSLGLSQTTVSRALNGYPEVSEATRLRVLSAAAERRYRPNRRATSLATGRAMAIGHVLPLYSRDEVVNPIFAEVIAGASETYNCRGYEMMLSMAASDDEEALYREVVTRGVVDGVILHLPQRNDARVLLLRQIGLPFVLHGRATELDTDYSWIDVNNKTAFCQAAQLLIDLGHTRIALVNGRETLDFAWRRRLGFERAMADSGLNVAPEWFSSTDMTETQGFAAAQRMLRLPNPPTAILTSSYILGLGVNRAITEAGLVMGADVSVVIHDDELSFFDNGGDTPLFTATRSSVREAGMLAAEMLLDLIDEPSRGPVSRLLECRLIIGRSTGMAPAS